MDSDSRDAGLAAHIESVSARAAPDTDRLIAAMLAASWPGGMGDRTNSVALDWVRGWGPRGAGAAPHACGCAAGRCRVCN